MEAHFLILSGANERAIVAACRDLDASNIGYSIIARPQRDPIARSSYLAHRVVATRKSDVLDIEDIVTAIAAVRHRMPARTFYLPASEALNRLVLAHRHRFESELGIRVPMPDMQTYLALSDKARFNEMVRDAGLAIPVAVADPLSAPLPVVAKPKTEFSAGGAKLYPVFLATDEERASFLATAGGEYFFQRYLEGQSHYYLFFFDGAGRCVSLFQENVAQQPGGKSIVAARSCSCPSPEFLDKVSQCIGATGFFGFCMIETITVDGTPYLIELNPRLWGPLSLAIRCGFRIAWLAAPETATQPRLDCSVRYAWLGGMLAARRNGGRLRWYPGQRQRFLAELPAFMASDIYLSSPRTWTMALYEALKND